MIIAQLSDLHVTKGGSPAYGAADTQSALIKTVQHLNRMIPEPDVALISGDISCDGCMESYETAREILAALKAPYYFVPGNHDHKANMIKAFPDHEYLTRAMVDTNGRHLSYFIDKYPVSLIGLDTVTRGNHGGGLSMDRLIWLENTLLKCVDKPVLLFMHHPPLPSGIGHMDGEAFGNRERFSDILKKNGLIRRITCGHIHRSIFTEFAGIPVTVSPAVGMQLVLDLTPDAPSRFIMEPAAYMVHMQLNDWDGYPRLVTHTGLVPDPPDGFGDTYPFL